MIAFQIENLGKVTSTNTLLLDRARQGAPEGLVLTARCQTLGRGKPGRTWVSPEDKNLLCSILLRPPLSPAQAPMLTQVACRAVAKVLKEKYDIASEFKRPNDVMAGGHKICGILVEALSSPSELEAVVIGIGLNVNAKASEIPPEGISMMALKERLYKIPEVLDGILEELGQKINELYENGTIK
ncbi:MAG TPA: biotin--[acetyl-CoA-carboxylase] ligase [Candidatus Omnitrophota bacterium]|nr:biotin--[acetyl-CoA-carboxylase] ligase [Candidatus Omnitrophota bacterium]HRY85656.1 biotin--[acetyl-CoA-carboxylase] ligase [Candidatus Omnitrophota bacterium]